MRPARTFVTVLVVPLLEAHGGDGYRFPGDGVLGVFGAREPLDDHADGAVAAAAAFVAVVEERFGGRLGVSVGVNSGLVLVGTGSCFEPALKGRPQPIRVYALAGGTR